MKVVRLSALRTGRLYHPGNMPDTHFCWRLSQPQGHVNEKFTVTPSGIKPATFRLVAQCLNRLRHRVPPLNVITDYHNLNTAPVAAGNILIAVFTDHQFLTVSVTDEAVWNAGVRMTRGENRRTLPTKEPTLSSL